MSITRRVLALSAVSFALLLAACGNGASETGGMTQFERAGDRAMGSPDAPVTLIEYASTSCPHCAEFHEEVFPSIESQFIETGEVRFVFREMLFGSASLAQAGFLIARCAPDDRYFDVIDLLFEQQQAIFEAAQGPNGTRDEFWNIAQSVGLSRDQFNACITDAEMRRDIVEAHETARENGINGTPRFVINGHILDAGRDGNRQVYFWNGEPLRIDGETVPAIVDEPTLVRILDHFVARSAAETEAGE
jgi:hypothetical protein